MKTTIEIADALLRESKEYAAARGLTFREVVEEGLRKVLGTQRNEAQPFRLRKRTFKGRGLARGMEWERIRELIYQGRGGKPA